MKFLFLSDLQLEAGAALGTGEYGAGSRFDDQVAVLERLATLAYEEGIECVGVLGDVFERSRPAPWAVLAFQRFVRALRAVDISVLVVSGNHDVRSAALPSALSIFDEGCVDIALTPSLYPFYDDDGGDPVAVLGVLPWTPISRLVAAQPNLSRGQVNDLAAAALVEGAQTLGARCYDEFPNAVPILVGHWAISGATLPTGLATDMLNEPVIPLDGLTSAGFAVGVFGHIHQAQVIKQDTPTTVVYCGSPMVCNWGEAASKHGVWIYDTEGPGKLSFRAIDDRPFVSLEPAFVEIAGDMAFTEPPGDVRDALVRVKYTVDEEVARKIDESKIRADLLTLGARKVFIKATVERAARARVAEVAEGLSDSAAFELWLATQEIPEADLQALRDLHAQYEERALA